MKHHNMYENQLGGHVADIVFVILFFLVRICLGGYLLIVAYYSKKTTCIFKIGAFAFYGINLLFFIQIVGFLGYVVVKFRLRPQSSSVLTTNLKFTCKHIIGFYKCIWRLLVRLTLKKIAWDLIIYFLVEGNGWGLERYIRT